MGILAIQTIGEVKNDRRKCADGQKMSSSTPNGETQLQGSRLPQELRTDCSYCLANV